VTSIRSPPLPDHRIHHSTCEEPGNRAGFFAFQEVTMADYYSPTVIQPPIPVAAMTPLERLLLENIFSASDSADGGGGGGGFYFYAEEGPVDFIVLSRAEIEEALAASNRNARSSPSAYHGWRPKRPRSISTSAARRFGN
jgi:hypothetical protein